VVKRTIQFRGDGVNLIADEWGDPGQQTVIFLHGGGQTRHSWKSAGRDLANAGFHTYSIDQRGHGDSDWAESGDYHISDLARDLLAVLSQIDGNVVLVGASMGGLASLLATDWAPDRVEALVLVDITTKAEPEGVERITTFMQGSPDGFTDLEEAADAVATYLPHRRRPQSTAGLKKNLRRRDDGRWYWHWDPALFNIREGGSEDVATLMENAAANVRIPTLLVWGMLSDVVSAKSVEQLRKLIPHLEVVELDKAAHTAAADDNDEFSATVVEFCRRVFETAQ
jgi:pimeloyl-ACP methyl ester carboxylesterase